MNKNLPIYKMVLNPENKDAGVDFIALVDEPAIQVNWFAFNKHEEKIDMVVNPEQGESKDHFLNRCIPIEINNGHEKDQAIAMCVNMYDKSRYGFKADVERKIIVSPAMIPNLPIYRKNEKMGEFYVIFDKEQINLMQEKFMENNYINNVNEMHQGNKILDGIIMKNSWVSDASMGIKGPDMFNDLPDGTWFVSYKFKDEAMWQKFVKEGEFKGISVEGIFDLVPYEEDKFDEEFEDLVNNITQY